MRGFFGSVSAAHTVGASVTVVRGDFNIVEDYIHFSTPPYGPIGPDGVETRSTFQGRAFSRRYDPDLINDRNFVLDDISKVPVVRVISICAEPETKVGLSTI